MRISPRRVYVILLLGTVLAGLAIHFHGIALAPAARDILGDALWAAMIFWLVSLATPNTRISSRVTAAVAICFAVEFSQWIEHPVLNAVRASSIGHLVIGSDFDARDLAAYAAGIAAAALFDRIATRSRRARASNPW